MKISSITNEDIFDLHPDKEKAAQLKAKATEKDPKLAWEKYKGDQAELKKREHLWAKHPNYAYYYAGRVIKGGWPEGEKAIASDRNYALKYAVDVLKDRFPAGEEAISKDALIIHDYVHQLRKHNVHIEFDWDTMQFREST